MSHRRRLPFIAWALIGLVFVLDIRLAGVSASLLYVGVLLLGLRLPNPRLIPWLTGVIAVLTVTSWLVSGHDDEPFATVNLGLAVAATMITGGGVFIYRRSEGRREATAGRVRDLQWALDQSAILSITDVRGTITYVNDAFCRISQYSRVDLIGQDHRVLNSGYHPPEFFRDMYETIGAGRVWRGEFRNRARDGHAYWEDTTFVPFLDARGEPYQYVAIHYDSTERREAETRLRNQDALARLGRMAAVVANEVRNPLAGMRSALQVIARRLSDESSRQIAAEMIGRIDTLDDIVRDLLEFARPHEPVLAPVELASLVRKVNAAFHAAGRQSGVTIVSDVEDGTIRADREMLVTVLSSLVLNAAQAMAGSGTVHVRGRIGAHEHELQVSDEGPGIAPDARPHIFEPFFTTKSQGTGLGLATVRRTVDGHGGRIDVDCPPGGGTTVTIRLPAEPPPRGGVPTATDQPSPGRGGAGDRPPVSGGRDGSA